MLKLCPLTAAILDPDRGHVAQSLVFLHHGWETFSGVRVSQSLVFCGMVCRSLFMTQKTKD
jgi:hypothetical protein